MNSSIMNITSSILLCLSLLFISCNKPCVNECGGNATCVKGECECIDKNMIKVINPYSGTAQLHFNCEYPYLFEGAYAYKPLNNDCTCANDISIFFYNCFVGASGIIAPCRSTVWHKDFERDMYVRQQYDIDAFFPAGSGDGDMEVWVEYGYRTGGQLTFCEGHEDIAAVIFQGHASEDLDTLYLNILYATGQWTPARDSCSVPFIRVKKEN